MENTNLMIKKKKLFGKKMKISKETQKLAKQGFDTYTQINVSLYNKHIVFRSVFLFVFKDQEYHSFHLESNLSSVTGQEVGEGGQGQG